MTSKHRQRVAKIDVHHHIFLPQLGKQKGDQNARVGWITPKENLPWSIEKSLRAMRELGVVGAVLSYPAGVPENLYVSPFQDPEKSFVPQSVDEAERSQCFRSVVRELNLHAQQLCDNEEASQGVFGWFACLPDLRDVDGALKEIAYALDVLHADGISLSSSYGQGESAVYLGHDSFDAIWAELDRRGAVVFVHGTQTPSSTPYPHDFLGLPVTEVPNETFKAAAHLVVTGKKRRYPNVKIILSHCGGSALVLAPRVAVLAAHMGGTLAPEACLEDFGTFYVETALSGHGTILKLAESTVGRSKVLFGSDFPAVSTEMADWYTTHLEACYADDAAALEEVATGTALKLFPRFQRVVEQRTGSG